MWISSPPRLCRAQGPADRLLKYHVTPSLPSEYLEDIWLVESDHMPSIRAGRPHYLRPNDFPIFLRRQRLGRMTLCAPTANTCIHVRRGMLLSLFRHTLGSSHTDLPSRSHG